MTRRVIRVAVADDSRFVRKAVERILEREPGIRVVGTAASGEELLDRLAAWRPDVITLDLEMPGMGGLRTLERLEELGSVPVIVLSTHTPRGAPQTIEALHRGAVDVIDKGRYSLVDFQNLGDLLVEKIEQVAAGARRRAPAGRSAVAPTPARRGARSPFELVAIGASAGGPPAVHRVLADLGDTVPVPVVVVQHMPEGFTGAFARRLNAHLPLAVREADDGERLLAGTVYIARAGRHLLVERRGGELAARLTPEPAEVPHRPSVDRLFESAAEAVGGRVLALLLTGMGRDGAAGMVRLAAAGAHTLVQDRATSVVFGMPRAALERRAAREVLPLGEIGGRLRDLLDGAAQPAPIAGLER